MALRGKGVLVSRGIADEFTLVDGCGADLNLKWLACCGTTDQLARDRVAGSNLGRLKFLQVGNVTRDNDLHATLTTTIIQFDEEKSFTTDSG